MDYRGQRSEGDTGMLQWLKEQVLSFRAWIRFSLKLEGGLGKPDDDYRRNH